MSLLQPAVGQHDAVEHLHEVEEKLRRKLADDANAAASRELQEKLAEVERERSEQERGLQQTIEGLRKQKEDLESQAQEELAAAEQRIRDEMERERSVQDRALQQTIEDLRKQSADLEHRAQEELAAAEKRIRDEEAHERSKREQGLQLTIDLLQRQNGDLERRLDGLSAPDRGAINEADIARDLTEPFPTMRSPGRASAVTSSRSFATARISGSSKPGSSSTNARTQRTGAMDSSLKSRLMAGPFTRPTCYS